MLQVPGILLFADVLEAGSFAAAARQRRTTRAAVAKMVARLEGELGARLFERSTRRMSPTDLGRRVYEHARRIRDEVEEVRAVVDGERSTLHGVLRIHSEREFGRRYVQPVALSFVREHPEVTVDLRLDDDDERDVDLAIQIGDLTDTARVARHIADVDRVLCAAPSYLALYERPTHPEQLAELPCVVFAERDVAIDRWPYLDDGVRRTVLVRGVYRVDDHALLLDAVKAGIGIGMLPRFLAADALAAGELETVLDAVQLPPRGPINAHYPAREHVPPRTRAFLDALVAEVGSPPVWSR